MCISFRILLLNHGRDQFHISTLKRYNVHQIENITMSVKLKTLHVRQFWKRYNVRQFWKRCNVCQIKNVTCPSITKTLQCPSNWKRYMSVNFANVTMSVKNHIFERNMHLQWLFYVFYVMIIFVTLKTLLIPILRLVTLFWKNDIKM